MVACLQCGLNVELNPCSQRFDMWIHTFDPLVLHPFDLLLSLWGDVVRRLGSISGNDPLALVWGPFFHLTGLRGCKSEIPIAPAKMMGLLLLLLLVVLARLWFLLDLLLLLLLLWYQWSLPLAGALAVTAGVGVPDVAVSHFWWFVRLIQKVKRKRKLKFRGVLAFTADGIHPAPGASDEKLKITWFVKLASIATLDFLTATQKWYKLDDHNTSITFHSRCPNYRSSNMPKKKYIYQWDPYRVSLRKGCLIWY